MAVFTVGQANARGVTRKQILVRVRRGQWHAVFPRVYATEVPSVVARREAALLYAGSPAALSHITAATIHGLGLVDEAVHVIIPHHRRIATQPGLVVHRTRTLQERDLRSIGGMLVTSVERTVSDCLVAMGPAVRAIAAAAVQQGRSTPRRLAEAAHRTGATRNHWIVDLLADLAGGSQSELELRFRQLCRDHGLPVPVCQRRVGAYFVDATFGELDVELDSRTFHFTQAAWERDLRRQNALMQEGRMLLRFTWRMVTEEPDAVAAEIRTALARLGDPPFPYRERGIPKERAVG